MVQSVFAAGICNVLLFSALANPALASGAVKQYDLKDFFSKPERSFFRLSADGKTLGFMQPYQRRQNLYIVTLPQDGKAPDFAKAKQLTSETERDVAGFFWKGSDSILFVKDFGGDENYHLLSVNVQSGEVKDLTPFPKIRASVVDDLLEDPDHVLVQHNKRDPQFFDVYRINVKTGESRLVAQNPGNITGWLTDHAGLVRIATTTDGVNSSLLYRASEADAFKTVLTTDFRTSVSPMFFTFDNRALYVLSNRGRDKTAFVVLDPDNGKESEPLFEHPEVDLGGASYSHKRKLLTQVSFTTWKGQRHVFDSETKEIYARLEKKLPGYEIALQNGNLAEDTFIVAAYNDRTPGTPK